MNTFADMVKKQVGFDVILLDSKLYPLIANESTAGIDFWKSNRKIIATSRSVFDKLVGKSPADEICEVDEEVVVVQPQRKKARVTQDIDTLGKEFTRPILKSLKMSNTLLLISVKSLCL